MTGHASLACTMRDAVIRLRKCLNKEEDEKKAVFGMARRKKSEREKETKKRRKEKVEG